VGVPVKGPGGRGGAGKEKDDLARALSRYIREKTNKLLVMMGSKPLRIEETDDRALLEMDPIGTISEAFGQVLSHTRRVNERLRSEIAERQRTEAALRESEERFRTLAEFASDWVFWRGADARMVYVSPASRQITGYEASEFYEDPGLIERIIHPEDFDLWQEHRHEADSQGLPGPLEFRIIAKGGDVRWISHVCRPVYGEGGEFLGVRGSNDNITERKQAEEALRESEGRLRDFLDNATDLIQSVGLDGRFLHVNRTWLSTLGYAEGEVAGLTLQDIVAPEMRQHCREMFRRVVSGEDVGSIEVTFVTRDGRRINVEGRANCRLENGRPVATRSIFRDVTERKRLEEDLLMARKLESIGVLAGGIAHDFNNILTAITGNISLAQEYAAAGGEDDRVAERVAEAAKACRKARELTQRLLTFSKGGAPIRRTSRIGDMIRDAAESALTGTGIGCDFLIAPDLRPVDIDEGQIKQAIRNLAENAAQATPAGGSIRVRARNAAGKEPGEECVEIGVEDRGAGIPRENFTRIFDPFFTTKENGTGLGLAAVHSIVQSHGGAVSFESRPGRGTTFRITLPVSAAPEPEGREERTGGPGRGRILVMDDDPTVRDVALSMLAHLGYKAAAARDGEEAIEAYRNSRESGAPFDAVIMDLSVPGGMGGKEAFGKIRELFADAVGIVSSGYSNDPVMSDFGKYGFAGVISKPYTLKELSHVLGSVGAAHNGA
jgi:two-component system cell cycle sensor histidine kinase/response regulator CckA